MAVEALSAVSSAASKASVGGARVVELSPSGTSIHAQSAQPHLEVRFRNAIDKALPAAHASTGINMPSPVKGMFDALDQVNVQAKSVSEYASTAEASGGQLTPGEIVQLTMKCQEFMFQCQLTSNIANRSSDGVQQLFRQQG